MERRLYSDYVGSDLRTVRIMMPFLKEGIERRNLGLGLFIAHELVLAHGRPKP